MGTYRVVVEHRHRRDEVIIAASNSVHAAKAAQRRMGLHIPARYDVSGWHDKTWTPLASFNYDGKHIRFLGIRKGAGWA